MKRHDHHHHEPRPPPPRAGPPSGTTGKPWDSVTVSSTQLVADGQTITVSWSLSKAPSKTDRLALFIAPAAASVAAGSTALLSKAVATQTGSSL